LSSFSDRISECARVISYLARSVWCWDIYIRAYWDLHRNCSFWFYWHAHFTLSSNCLILYSKLRNDSWAALSAYKAWLVNCLTAAYFSINPASSYDALSW